ncbi:MAG: hypothetical protein EB059_05390 [Alphaproteobacteria bacterium]|nr:hypothetical protein [Alphaproteobacteria bacterium]
MLNIFVIIIALFASASVAVAETASNATPRFPILIVDVKNVLDDSKAAIGAQKKIETQRSAFQDEISACAGGDGQANRPVDAGRQ